MAFHISINCFPWDLVDEGIDTVLDRLKGEAGVTGVSVPFSCGPVEQLRPHAGVSPRTFRSRGGVQFQPDTSHYAGTRIRPVVADWLRKTNPLPAIAEACAKRGLTFCGSLECCHSPITVERYEACAVKDVFGDINPSWLCPVNPDVREYLCSLVREIDSTYHPETLELDEIGFPFNPSQLWWIKWQETVAQKGENIGVWLHSLCFCESCRQASRRDGIDVSAVARSAGITIERILASGDFPDESLEDFVSSDPNLSAFADWRCDQIKSLLGLIKKSCECRLEMYYTDSHLKSGINYSTIERDIERDIEMVAPLGIAFSDSAVNAIVKTAVNKVGEAGRIELEFDICKSFCSDAATLVRTVAQAATLGVRRINISNYGEMPLNRLAWIKQAARYVQREFT